jgi:hypothetical protein
MRRPPRTTPLLLTLALGLGVWSVALNYTPVTNFVDGNILTAAQLNAEFAAIQTAIGSKLSLTGGTLSGRLNVGADASTTGSGDVTTVLDVRNTATTGHAAVFRAQAGSTNPEPVVAIKGNGVGPALSVKNANAGGTLIAGTNASEVRFVVEHNGSIRVGALGSDGTDAPNLRIDAATGTIRNAVGSGLPVVYGSVTSTGVRINNSSTSNFTSLRTGTGVYQITVTGFSFDSANATTIVTARSDASLRSATAFSRSVGGQTVLEVRTYNQAGTLVDAPFGFVTFKPGS